MTGPNDRSNFISRKSHLIRMSHLEADFDRLALLDEDGWTSNNHYHNFLLRNVPENCVDALEIGCGTGAFSRRLAEVSKHVVALDLSPEMIRVARSRSKQFPNIDFQLVDAMSWDFPAAHFDCISTIATLHHLPQRELLLKAKRSFETRWHSVGSRSSGIERAARLVRGFHRPRSKRHPATYSQRTFATPSGCSRRMGGTRQNRFVFNYR